VSVVAEADHALGSSGRPRCNSSPGCSRTAPGCRWRRCTLSQWPEYCSPAVWRCGLRA